MAHGYLGCRSRCMDTCTCAWKNSHAKRNANTRALCGRRAAPGIVRELRSFLALFGVQRWDISLWMWLAFVSVCQESFAIISLFLLLRWHSDWADRSGLASYVIRRHPRQLDLVSNLVFITSPCHPVSLSRKRPVPRLYAVSLLANINDIIAANNLATALSCHSIRRH